MDEYVSDREYFNTLINTVYNDDLILMELSEKAESLKTQLEAVKNKMKSLTGTIVEPTPVGADELYERFLFKTIANQSAPNYLLVTGHKLPEKQFTGFEYEKYIQQNDGLKSLLTHFRALFAEEYKDKTDRQIILDVIKNMTASPSYSCSMFASVKPPYNSECHYTSDYVLYKVVQGDIPNNAYEFSHLKSVGKHRKIYTISPTMRIAVVYSTSALPETQLPELMHIETIRNIIQRNSAIYTRCEETLCAEMCGYCTRTVLSKTNLGEYV